MRNGKLKSTKIYFIAMAAFWFVFGLITTFYPSLMNMFQTESGISAVTNYSDHIWRHDGFDIIAISVLLFALSRETASRNILRATAVAALLVTIAITTSLLTTPYWNMLFLVPGLSCFAFAVWGFMLSTKIK
jgi:ABC-type multidrug transport system fused ATPase/permease subunit